MSRIFLLPSVAASASVNPFADQSFYVNPANQREFDTSIASATGDVQVALKEMREVPSAYWIDNKSKLQGASTESLSGILADAAAKSPPELVVLIFYDLPNRDCDAKASNGEMCCYANADGTCNYDQTGDCAEGIAQYKSEYVDPFVSIVASYQGKVPIVLVVEPDSLPNLATNSGHPHCGNTATYNAYTKGTAYAVQELTSKTDAAIYMDAAHGGWLGWSDNLDKYLSLLKEMDLPFDKMRGFATNVANYQPLGTAMCPWTPDQGYRNAYCLNGQHQDDPCCADPCRLESQYNPANSELNYAQALVNAAKGELNFDAHAIIDTGRNGVMDMRQDCSNWCNIRGAGAGLKSTVQTANASVVDAYFWLKTPGESDGCSQTLPSGEACPRYDSMCGSADSLGMQSSEPAAPEAGQWFDFQVKQLAANAHMSAGPSPPPVPTPSPSPVPTPSPTPSPSPSPVPAPTPPTPPAGGKCCWGGCSGDCHTDFFCDSGAEQCTGNCGGSWCATVVV